MMNRTALIALFCAIGTSVWTWWPKAEVADTVENAKSQVMTSSGQPVDASKVAAIRVVTLDDASKGPKPFEVRRTNGQWIIPSHFDYPADGGTMVGETAGAVLNLPMGPLVTADETSHGEYGVLDPLDQGSGSGAGKRVTLSDEGGAVLVDVIIGRQKSDTDVYFVRRANEDNIYTAKVQPNSIKANFKDWVETDLMKLAQNDIVEVTVKDYSVDETTGTLQNRSTDCWHPRQWRELADQSASPRPSIEGVYHCDADRGGGSFTPGWCSALCERMVARPWFLRGSGAGWSSAALRQ